MKQLILSLVTIKPSEAAKEMVEEQKSRGSRKPQAPKPPVISQEELAALQSFVQSEVFLSQVGRMFTQADKDKSGFLDYEEIKKVLQGFVKYMADSGYRIPNPNEETYRRVVMTIDSNNDNYVSLEEFTPFVQDFIINIVIFKALEGRKVGASPESSPSKVPPPPQEWHFACKEKDLEKIKAHVNSNQFMHTARKLFDDYDSDSNGWLDQEECKPIASKVIHYMQEKGMNVPDARHEEVAHLLNTMDTDRNGRVTWEEFHYALKRLVIALLTHKPAEMVEKKKDQQKGISVKRLIATEQEVDNV